MLPSQRNENALSLYVFV